MSKLHFLWTKMYFNIEMYLRQGDTCHVGTLIELSPHHRFYCIVIYVTLRCWKLGDSVWYRANSSGSMTTSKSREIVYILLTMLYSRSRAGISEDIFPRKERCSTNSSTEVGNWPSFLLAPYWIEQAKHLDICILKDNIYTCTRISLNNINIRIE